MDDVLGEIARTTWTQLTGSELEVGSGSSAEGAFELSAWQEIGGPWRGAVVLECSRAHARHLARAWLQAEPAPADERDALLELVNIVSGHLQALLPAAERSALPQASEAGYPSELGQPLSRACFRYAERDLRWQLLGEERVSWRA